jgi:N-acetylmuramoyl-L-alanine amidase
MRVVISSGHGKYIRGASYYIDEVDQARRVVNDVAERLNSAGLETVSYHDDVSKTQDENLKRIVDFHNSKSRDLDISVHFNSATFNGSDHTSNPVGCEIFYTSGTGLEYADEMVDNICTASGLKNRGPKESDKLYFLNNTSKPAILVEVCFVNSKADVDIYNAQFYEICDAIASTLSGSGSAPIPPQPDVGVLFETSGKCSHFGGPEDMGVSPSEGLAFIFNVSDNPYLFLPSQPSGTTGLARRLNPYVHYVACRWDYSVTSKNMLKSGKRAKVTAPHNSYELLAFPADWGPNQNTGRVADLSPGLMEALGLATDDEVEVIFPWED